MSRMSRNPTSVAPTATMTMLTGACCSSAAMSTSERAVSPPSRRDLRTEPARDLVPAKDEHRVVRTGFLALAAAGALRLFDPHEAEMRRRRVHVLLEVEAIEWAALGALF